MKLAHTPLYLDIKSKGYNKEQMREIRKELIKVIDSGIDISTRTSLEFSFCWVDSPQGEDYWVNIYMKHYEKAMEALNAGA